MAEDVWVKVAVCVDASGHWVAHGWGTPNADNSQEAMDLAIDGVDPGEKRYFLVAKLVTPEVREVMASVVSADSETDESREST